MPQFSALNSNLEELEQMVDLEIYLHLWGGEFDSKVKWKRRRQIRGLEL